MVEEIQELLEGKTDEQVQWEWESSKDVVSTGETFCMPERGEDEEDATVANETPRHPVDDEETEPTAAAPHQQVTPAHARETCFGLVLLFLQEGQNKQQPEVNQDKMQQWPMTSMSFADGGTKI